MLNLIRNVFKNGMFEKNMIDRVFKYGGLKKDFKDGGREECNVVAGGKVTVRIKEL